MKVSKGYLSAYSCFSTHKWSHGGPESQEDVAVFWNHHQIHGNWEASIHLRKYVQTWAGPVAPVVPWFPFHTSPNDSISITFPIFSPGQLKILDVVSSCPEPGLIWQERCTMKILQKIIYFHLRNKKQNLYASHLFNIISSKSIFILWLT